MTLSSDLPRTGGAKPRLVFLVTEYYFFHAMSQDLAPPNVREAFEVIVVAFCGNSAAPPRDAGLTVIDFPWRRSRSLVRAALQFLPEFLRVRRLLAELAPDVLHNIALKPTIIGALAVWNRDVKIVNSLTGFGFLFYARSWFARLAQKVCAVVLQHAARRNDAHIVVHNTTDVDFATSLGVPATNVRLVRGLGIDTARFAPLPQPAATPFRFLMITRLLYMKGIEAAVAAHAELARRGTACELIVCGGPDADNPSTIPESVIAEWARRPGVRFPGQVSDVRPFIAESHVVMHPALGGEGLPRVLLEGAASGRPLIATDVSGNRDIVVAGENGLLIPPSDVLALADAMEWMMAHPLERERMGLDGRERVLREFASPHIAAGYTAIYRELCPAAFPGTT